MQTIEIVEVAAPVKKEKVERRNILGLADAHFYFKTTSAQHAVNQLRQIYPEVLSTKLKVFFKINNLNTKPLQEEQLFFL